MRGVNWMSYSVKCVWGGGGSRVYPNADMLSCSVACRHLMSLTVSVTPLQ